MQKYQWKAIVEEFAHLRRTISQYGEVIDADNEWINDLLDCVADLEKENKKLKKQLKKAKKK